MQILRTDAVKHWLGSYIAESIRESIQLPIEIEVAEVTGFNGINLSNVTIYDLEGDTLLYAAEGNVNLSPLSLFGDIIEINTLTFASPRLSIKQETDKSKSNLQLLVEHILKQKKREEEKRIGVTINQIHIYGGMLSYDILEENDKEPGFLPSHIRLSDFTLNASLREIGPERADIYLRRLSFKERSGLELKRLKMNIEATPTNISLKDIALSLPYSYIQSDKIDIDLTDKKNPHIAGNIYSNNFHTNDIEAFTYGVLADEDLIFDIKTNFSINGENIEISNLDIKDEREMLHISADGFAKGIKGKELEAHINIDRLDVKDESLEQLYSIAYSNIINRDSTQNGKIPTTQQVCDILTHLSLNGNIYYKDKEIRANIGLSSNVGDAHIHFDNEKTGKYNGKISANNIAVKEIMQKGECLSLDIEAEVEGEYLSKNDFNGSVNSTVSNLIFKDYHYSPINISASFTNESVNSNIRTEDKNLTADINFEYNSQYNKNYTIDAVVDAFAPTQLNLAKDKDYGTVSFAINGSHEEKSSKEHNTSVKISEIDMLRGDEMYHIENINIFDETDKNSHSLVVISDVMNCHIKGKFKYTDIAASIENIIIEELSAIQPKRRKKHIDNSYAFIINIARPTIICDILQLPIKVNGPTMIKGECVDETEHIKLEANLTDLQYGNNIFDELTINTTTNDEGIVCNANAIIQRPTKNNANNRLSVNVISKIDDNNIDNNIYWNASDSIKNNGNLSFNLDIENRNNEMRYKTVIAPSKITLNSDIWEMSQSTIDIAGGKIAISDFSMKNNENGIHINGIAGELDKDSITLELKNVNIEDIFRATNFKKIKIGGLANGKITASNIYKDLKADINIKVDDCTFHDGKLGTLDMTGEWSKKQNGLKFSGIINEDNIATTLLDGHITEQFDSIELKIYAHNTNAEFLNGIIPNIIKDANVRANGIARIGGPFNDIVLEGDLEVTGKLRIRSTGVLYSINKDTIHLRNGGIDFRQFVVHDESNNTGYLNGTVTHRNFKNFACNLDVRAENLLAMDFKEFGNMTFYGNAYLTGDANILFTLKDGLFITGNVVPTSASEIVYNASAPLGATNSEFVTFNDRNKKDKTIVTISHKDSTDIGAPRTNLDFRVNGTKNVKLRIYTNLATQDYIELYGGGGGEDRSIRVMYNEKSDIELEGILNVEQGTYKFTMQDIFHKEFDIQDGSSINFAGNPFDAELNLKTIYTISSVSLSALDPLAKARENVSVNCLMNIGGTMRKPALTFGIELQTGSEEDRELLASAINTPEQINTQFIYLLSIGNFYTYGYNQNSGNDQSLTAMESLLSTTLSGQINNMLSKIIDNENWTLSSNISASDRSSMEVGGTMRGRYDRFIINGRFGYRENPISDSNFIGNFEVQWLWLNSENANAIVRGYNKTNERQFTKTSLNTQGVGLTFRYEFDKWKYIFGRKKTKKEEKSKEEIEHNK